MLLRVSPPTAAVTVAHANRGDRVPGRLDWLDGLRFCAIFGVMLSHVAYALPALGRDWVIGLASGRYGVDLFFAISGFLFAELMIGRRMEAWRYLCRRGLRIIAVYYLAAGLYLWLAPTRPSLSVLAANAAFLNTWFNPTIAEVVPGGWSICDEVFFYLSGVLLLPWLRTSQRTAACWAVVLATCMLLARFGPGLQFANAQSPLMNLPTFLGGVLGWHYRDAAPRPRVALAVTLGCLVVTVAAALQVLPFGQRYVFGCVAAVGAWAGGSVLRAWSLTPRLAAYGKLSYSLYAFHFAVLDVVLVLVVAAFPTGSSAQLMAAVTFPVVLVATWPVAFLVHRYVETPVSRLLRGPARAAP